MRLHVYDSKNLLPSDQLSSSPSYDAALSSIFPHYVWVPIEAGTGLAALLASGYPVLLTEENPATMVYPSFALVLNDRRPGGKILWLSSAALGLLHYHSIDITHHKQSMIKD